MAIGAGLPVERFEMPSAKQRCAPLCPSTYRCADCDTLFTGSARANAYCSARCKTASGYVRYHRGVIARFGKDVPEDVLLALKTKLAHALGDGYDAAARRVPPERRAEVIDRDGGKCVLCEKPGDEIDHIAGSNDDLSNLRLLCRGCHHEVTASHFMPIAEQHHIERALWLKRRVRSPEPLRPCDVADWRQNWRQWVRENAR